MPVQFRRARVLVLMLLALLLAACTGEERSPVRIERAGAATPAPEPPALAVAVPDGLVDRFTALLSGPLPGYSGPRAGVVPAGSRAAVQVERAAAGEADAPVARWWAVATGTNRLDVDNISMADVTRAATAGALYAAEEHVAALTELLPADMRITAVAAARLSDTLDRSASALALMPVDLITTRVRALGLEGRDPVRGEGDIGGYPLVSRVRIRATSATSDARALGDGLTRLLGAPAPAPIRVTFTGDVIASRCVHDAIVRTGDWTSPFRATGDRLRGATLAVASIDSSISAAASPIGCRETFNLLASPRIVEGLTWAGIDVATVAANHAKDCGTAGFCGDRAFLDSLANLRAAGIYAVGGGETLSEARRPVVVEVGGVRFAFLGYDDIAAYYHATPTSPGTAGLDLDTLADDVRAARRAADVVIVLPHWGEEYTADPTPRQVRGARIAVEAGAALVVGNHPHTVQAAASIGGGYVAWALGNFVFDQDWSVETTEGVILEATFLGTRLAAVRFAPVRIEGRLQPVFLDGPRRGAVLGRMMAAADKLEP